MKQLALHRRYGRSSGGPSGYTRVGVAFGKPHGASQRRDEYGIYESPAVSYGVPVPPEERRLYAKYEGYREQRVGGEAQVGLPLGGPHWSPQPMIDFVPEHFGTVRFFDGRQT